MNVFRKYNNFGQTWIRLYLILALTSIAVYGEVYHSCEEAQIKLRSSAVDGIYQIMTSSGHAVNLYCHGFKSQNPKEYLVLPAGRSKNYASVYDYVSLPYECYQNNPRKFYSKRGRTEFDKVAFDIAANSIMRNDFTFTHTYGPNNISYGTAGGMFSPLPRCPPRGVFNIDLTGTPFIIHQKVRWKWDGQFQDGARNGTVQLSKYEYIGCYKDSNRRVLPMLHWISSSMTVAKCILRCRGGGYYYAGLEFGRHCFCGNNYNKLGHADPKRCNVPCSGQKYRKCGGALTLSVYTAGQSHYRVGRCGGYPAKCYPVMTDGQERDLLFLQFNPTHPCKQNICAPFGTCVATTSDGFFCKCPKGYIGSRCQATMEQTTSGRSCPADYQPKSCSCEKSDCYGAKLQNGHCYTNGGKAKLTCRYGKVPAISITEVHSKSNENYVRCPPRSTMLSCTYYSSSRTKQARGNGMRPFYRNTCRSPCKQCTTHATCLQYFCACKNGGTCDIQSNTCICRPGYTGAFCEEYDYCSYWEKAHQKAACSNAGICRSVELMQVKTTGGDNARDVCQLPFTFKGQTFSRCVSNNKIGPPYSCGGSFDGNNTYIDMGQWSPGPKYTIAAWVKPTLMDQENRLIAGGIYKCYHFGIAYQHGMFQAYYSPPKDKKLCTVPMTSSNIQYAVHQWHSVAVVNTGIEISLIVNGKKVNSKKTQPHFLATANGFWIGGGPCCSGNSFSGMIKNVKVWNQALSESDIAANFQNNDVNDSPEQVLKKGLVAHYELGDLPKTNCSGIDHNNNDWIPEHQSQISGRHCNIKRFVIEPNTKVYVHHWNGTAHGHLEVEAQSIYIYGELNANGAGYRGGQTSNKNGDDGRQGDSYSNKRGGMSTDSNAGGGGGGLGEMNMKAGGRPGGGGSHGTLGKDGSAKLTNAKGSGKAGEINKYGGKFSLLYMGSGGGSGGNPLNIDESPRGGDGGNGGGAISLTSEAELIVKGKLTAQGSDGVGDPNHRSCFACPTVCKSTTASCDAYNPMGCYDKSGPGGGGSGGSIHISGLYVNIGTDRLNTDGGLGGQGAMMCGGRGGVGRILIESSHLYGSVSKYYGIVDSLSKKDTFKDFSSIGRTVTGGQKKTNENAVYLGCFRDTEESLLQLKQNMLESEVSPENCHALCSKKNFKFSGTKGGKECFCDNNLDPSNRVDESECTLKCSGSALHSCGGPDTLLVFGLRRQLYGIGQFGIASECKGWCVTAGSETKDPKWGECTDEEQTLSISLTCQCPSGKYGIGCDKDCPSSVWGIDCLNNCTCKNNVTCNAVDGECDCPKGWRGFSCDIRSDEYCTKSKHYGPSCKPCDCSGHDCDPVTGVCKCDSEDGDKCEEASGLNGGAIAGIVIGILILIGVVAGGAVLLKRNQFSFHIGPIKYETQENEVTIPAGFGDDFLENVVNEVNAAASAQSEEKKGDSL